MWILIAVTIWAGAGEVGAQWVRSYSTESQCAQARSILMEGRSPERDTVYFCTYTEMVKAK